MKFLTEESFNNAVNDAVSKATTELKAQVDSLNAEKETLTSSYTTALAAKDEEIAALKTAKETAEAQVGTLTTEKETLTAENARLVALPGAAPAAATSEAEAGEKGDGTVTDDKKSFMENVAAVKKEFIN